MKRHHRTALALAITATCTAPAAADTYTWSAGSFVTGTTAPEPLAAGDVLNIQGGSSKRFDGATFTSNGTVLMVEGVGNVLMTGNAAVTSHGLWEFQSNGGLLNNTGVPATFTSTGIVRKTGGTATSIGNGPALTFVNSGTIDVQVGTLTLGGSNVVHAGSVFTGAGNVVINEVSTFNGSFTAHNLSFATSSSVLMTGNDAVMNGTVGWSGAGFTGRWTVAPGSTFNAGGASATGNKAITGAATVFTNQGTVVLNSATGIGLGQGASIVNTGVIDLQSNAGLSGTGTLSNTGVLRKSGGSGSTTVGSNANFTFVNSGVIDVQTGTMQIAGVNTFNAGTVFSGAGAVQVPSASTFNGAFTSSNLLLNGISSVPMQGNGAVLHGTMGWTGGALVGSWTVAPGATLTGLGASATGNKAMRGADTVLTNEGRIVWDSFTGLSIADGARIVNNGVHEFQGNAGLFYNGTAASGYTNHGLIVKTGGTGVTSLGDAANWSVANHGTIDVQVGTIRLPDNFANDGVLQGDGALQSSGGFTNRGTIAPGSAGTGTLTLANSLTQAAEGTLAIELTTLTDSDLLNINGSAFLNGTLALSCLGACSFAVGDVITVLDATVALSGSFSQLTLGGFATGAFSIVYDVPSDSVRLLVTEAVTAVPEPGIPALLLAGLGALGWLARRRR